MLLLNSTQLTSTSNACPACLPSAPSLKSTFFIIVQFTFIVFLFFFLAGGETTRLEIYTLALAILSSEFSILKVSVEASMIYRIALVSRMKFARMSAGIILTA